MCNTLIFLFSSIKKSANHHQIEFTTYKLGRTYCLRVHLVWHPAYLWMKRCRVREGCSVIVGLSAAPRISLQGFGLLICCFQHNDIPVEGHPELWQVTAMESRICVCVFQPQHTELRHTLRRVPCSRVFSLSM